MVTAAKDLAQQYDQARLLEERSAELRVQQAARDAAVPVLGRWVRDRRWRRSGRGEPGVLNLHANKPTFASFDSLLSWLGSAQQHSTHCNFKRFPRPFGWISTTCWSCGFRHGDSVHDDAK